MATQTVPADDRAVSAAEFARLRGVHRSQVTRYVKDGKISGEALVPSGRGVKIRVEIAMAQLRERLDIGQQIGNGIDARTSIVPDAMCERSASRSGGSLFAEADDMSVEAQIKREREGKQPRRRRVGVRRRPGRRVRARAHRRASSTSVPRPHPRAPQPEHLG